MSEYDCTHCGRAPVLEGEIEDLKAENARLQVWYDFTRKTLPGALVHRYDYEIKNQTDE